MFLAFIGAGGGIVITLSDFEGVCFLKYTKNIFWTLSLGTDQSFGRSPPLHVVENPIRDSSWGWSVEGAFSRTECVLCEPSLVVIGNTSVFKKIVSLLHQFLYSWEAEELLSLVLLSCPTSKRYSHFTKETKNWSLVMLAAYPLIAEVESKAALATFVDGASK